MKTQPILLSIVELGGYPDFTPIYQRCGYEVVSTNNVRKAVKLIKKHTPSVVVTEFNFQSDFRDRTSTLETVVSTIQGVCDARVIVFYEKEVKHQYDRFLAQFTVHASIVFPVDEELLENAVQQTM